MTVPRLCPLAAGVNGSHTPNLHSRHRFLASSAILCPSGTQDDPPTTSTRQAYTFDAIPKNGSTAWGSMTEKAPPTSRSRNLQLFPRWPVPEIPTALPTPPFGSTHLVLAGTHLIGDPAGRDMSEVPHWLVLSRPFKVSALTEFFDRQMMLKPELTPPCSRFLQLALTQCRFHTEIHRSNGRPAFIHPYNTLAPTTYLLVYVSASSTSLSFLPNPCSPHFAPTPTKSSMLDEEFPNSFNQYSCSNARNSHFWC